MTITVLQLGKQLDVEVVGDGTQGVESLCPVESHRPGAIFPVLKPRYAFELAAGEIALTTPPIAASGNLGTLGTLLVSPQPIVALATLIELFYPTASIPSGVHPSAVVEAGSEVHPSVYVGAGAVVEAGVSVGEGTIIGPRVVVHRNTHIGKYVVIGSGAVIGYDGFGFVPVDNGILKIPQVGGVQIGDFVEIGANSCIDRGTLGDTVVGAGTKIDNLVQIGHNVKIGKNVIIAAQTGLAGSTILADGAMLGGQVGVADHLRIGVGARVGAKSGVIGDVADGDTVSGYPAMSRWQWLRVIAKLKK
ncbi:MAG: UDP-3-O-(3-hydroxymyristoyl)glucosamine N-acyltransferase [Deltaproteobacteria bacterium]|nr:UDP-3-O-(3-hydroxymyristoyl)glucosamine N-acyltransferase [Deltaproteobacteria bacterium]MBN2673608.1 UDP-3-O-(3-hydroxymyristoyl)glucosamine N-acyltransferase [Deltaproteobacteria bacterium]